MAINCNYTGLCSVAFQWSFGVNVEELMKCVSVVTGRRRISRQGCIVIIIVVCKHKHGKSTSSAAEGKQITLTAVNVDFS